MEYGPISACQVCGSTDLRSALFLGFLPPVNGMRPLDAPADAEPWFPAELLICPACHLAQLGYAVPSELLFPPDYPYTSGSTKVLRENFADLAQEVQERVGLFPGDLIVDVGSNDGTLLANFTGGESRVLGIEPTNAGDLATEQGIPTYKAFFDLPTAARVLAEHGPARIVTAANVFAHILDVHQVLDAVTELIGDEGAFISESHYLGDLIETLQYDTIYHEHLRYYSLTSLTHLLAQHGLRVFHVKRIPTHGGSIRVYASRSAAFDVDASVAALRREEDERRLADDGWVPDFRRRVVRSKLELMSVLRGLKEDGARVYGIGAPSRASTLINYVGLDDAIVDCVLEISGSKKIGKFLPGTAIPVIDEAKLYDDQPEYALLLSWHIADELIANLQRHGYRGDFIVPLPEPRVLSAVGSPT